MTAPAKPRRVYVSDSQHEHANWTQSVIVDSLAEADYLLLTGGSDVDPSRYGEVTHPTTHSNPKRDAIEFDLFAQAVAMGKPILGVCRGSQLSCVASGGRLVQHMSPTHPYYHPILTDSGATFTVPSDHHQAQFPWELPAADYRVIAWADNLSTHHYDGAGHELVNPDGKEVEIAYYRKTRALACQHHPEYVYGDPAHAKLIAYIRSLLDGLLAGTL